MIERGNAGSSLIRLRDGTLRCIEETDLKLVLKWRNSERIRSNMFSDHRISADEHKQWFKNIDREYSDYLIFEYMQKPVGLINFTDINRKNNTCKWGFYLGESNVPPGTGLLMGYLSMEYVFKVLSARKLCSEVLYFNTRSIKYHKKLGFQEEGLLRKHILRSGNYEDILLLAMFHDDWIKMKGTIETGLSM